jgi:hypothetical protein
MNFGFGFVIGIESTTVAVVKIANIGIYAVSDGCSDVDTYKWSPFCIWSFIIRFRSSSGPS